MAEINVASSQKSNKSKRLTGNRLSTRVDLTPMVDLGFLLVTFFVFTTTMNEPKAMSIIETKGEESRPTKESGAMTIILGANNSIFYYLGQLNRVNSESLQKTDFKSIRSILLSKKRKTDPKDLMVIIKADSLASFGNVIKILDEMAICQIPTGHYAELEMSDLEAKWIKEKAWNK